MIYGITIRPDDMTLVVVYYFITMSFIGWRRYVAARLDKLREGKIA